MPKESALPVVTTLAPTDSVRVVTAAGAASKIAFSNFPSTGGGVASVANYAALRALTTSSPGLIFVTAPLYSGFFWYNASDTTSADNGGTIIVPTATLAGRWYRLLPDDAFYWEWFGAVGGNSSGDDSTAIIACLAANAARGGGRCKPLQGPGVTFYLSQTLVIDPRLHSISDAVLDFSNKTFVNPASPPNLISDPTFTGTGSYWTADPLTSFAPAYDGGSGGLEWNLGGIVFVGSIAATTLNVTTAGANPIYVGMSFSGGTSLATITAFGTGSGGIGTYTISVSQTVAGGTTFNGYSYLEMGQGITCANGQKLTVTIVVGTITQTQYGSSTFHGFTLSLRANIGGSAANCIENGGNVGAIGSINNTDPGYAYGATYVFNVTAGGANPFLRIAGSAGIEILSVSIQVVPNNVCVLWQAAANTTGNTWHEARNLKVQTTLSGATQNYVIGFEFDTEVSGGVGNSRLGVYNCDVSSGIGVAVQFGNNAYLNAFYACRFTGSLYSINCPSGATDAGENIAFFGGNIGGSSVAINSPGGFELDFHGVSMDFSTQLFVGAGGAAFYGCHIELGAASSGGVPYIVLNSGELRFKGGLFQIDGSTTPQLPTPFQIAVGGHLIFDDLDCYNLQGTTGALAAGIGTMLGTTTSASAIQGATTLVLTSVTGAGNGWLISGPGIAANTTVTLSGSTATLSTPTTAAVASGAAVTLTPPMGRFTCKMRGGPNKNCSMIAARNTDHNTLGLAGTFDDPTLEILAWVVAASGQLQVNAQTLAFPTYGTFTADVLEGCDVLQNLSVDLTSSYSQAVITNNVNGVLTANDTAIATYQNTGFTFTGNTTLGNQTISSMSTAPTSSNAYNKYISGSGIVQGAQIVAYSNSGSSITVLPSPSATATGVSITTDKIAVLDRPWIGPSGSAQTIAYYETGSARAGIQLSNAYSNTGAQSLEFYKTGVGSGAFECWIAIPIQAARAMGMEFWWCVPPNSSFAPGSTTNIYFDVYFGQLVFPPGAVIPTIVSYEKFVSDQPQRGVDIYDGTNWAQVSAGTSTNASGANDGYSPVWATHVLLSISLASVPNGFVMYLDNLFANMV